MRRLAAERGRRRLRAGGGRAPRTREAGVAVRAHYGALPSMAGRGTGLDGKPHPPRPRKHGPRSEIAAVARRKALRGCSFVADGEADRVKTTLRAFRRAAPLVVSRGNGASLGRCGAARTEALGCLKFEQEARSHAHRVPDALRRVALLRRSGTQKPHTLQKHRPRICEAILRIASRPGNETPIGLLPSPAITSLRTWSDA